VFLTPHIGSATTQTRDAMGFLLLEAMQALEEGRTPGNYFGAMSLSESQR
jgi:glyoxylate reductase